MTLVLRLKHEIRFISQAKSLICDEDGVLRLLLNWLLSKDILIIDLSLHGENISLSSRRTVTC